MHNRFKRLCRVFFSASIKTVVKKSMRHTILMKYHAILFALAFCPTLNALQNLPALASVNYPPYTEIDIHPEVSLDIPP